MNTRVGSISNISTETIVEFASLSICFAGEHRSSPIEWPCIYLANGEGDESQITYRELAHRGRA